MSLTEAINNLKTEMKSAGIEQEHGLGTELFHFSSTLAPVVNVDLLITDEDNRVLLSWREDDYTESGWHVPGSCIRFQETLEEAIQRCARNELGAEVEFITEPIKVYEFHWNSFRSTIADQRERAHFITLVYACRLPSNYVLDVHNQPHGRVGCLQWFDDMPEDILPIQKCYYRDWKKLKNRIVEGKNVKLD